VIIVAVLGALLCVLGGLFLAEGWPGTAAALFVCGALVTLGSVWEWLDF
jgi:hypothetical protein